MDARTVDRSHRGTTRHRLNGVTRTAVRHAETRTALRRADTRATVWSAATTPGVWWSAVAATSVGWATTTTATAVPAAFAGVGISEAGQQRRQNDDCCDAESDPKGLGRHRRVLPRPASRR